MKNYINNNKKMFRLMNHDSSHIKPKFTSYTIEEHNKEFDTNYTSIEEAIDDDSEYLFSEEEIDIMKEEVEVIS